MSEPLDALAVLDDEERVLAAKVVVRLFDRFLQRPERQH